MPDYRPDLLGAFLAGALSMAAVFYLIWLKAGRPAGW